MDLNKRVDFYFKREKNINALYRDLQSIGDIYFMGGIARELYNCSKTGDINNVRDIDIVIDSMGNYNLFNLILQKYHHQINKFGGCKIHYNGVKIDVWEISNTWAFKSNIIKCDSSNMGKELQNTVFLNYDSIVYDMKNKNFYYDKYINCLSEKVLDIVLEDNPHIYLNLVRTLEFKVKTGYSLSYNLKRIYRNLYKSDEYFINQLYEIEKYRDNIMTKQELISEVESVVNGELWDLS